MSEDLLIKLKTEYQDKGLKDLTTGLRQATEEYVQMSRQYKEGSVQAQNAGAKINYFSGEILNAKNNIKDFTQHNKLSTFQLMEFGENLTTVSAGVIMSVDKIKSLVSGFVELTEKGAEYGLMRKHFDETNGGIEESTKAFELLKKASDGTLDNRKILEYDNRMKDLNFTTKQSTQVLDIATTKHHELGIAIEEGTSRITRYIETGNKRGLYTMGMDFGTINNKIFEQTGLTEKLLKQKTAEEQITIRTNAVLELYGKSLDEISKKQLENADIIAQIGVAYENAKLKIGEFFSGAVAKLADLFGLTSEKMATFIVIAGGITVMLLAITAAVIGLTIAFSALDVVTGGILIVIGAIVLQVSLLTAAIVTNWDKIKGWYDEHIGGLAIIQNLQVAFNNLKNAYDELSQKFSGISNFDGFFKIIEKIAELLIKGFIAALRIAIAGINEIISAVSLAVDGFNFLWNIIKKVFNLLSNVVPTGFINTLIKGLEFVIDTAMKGLTLIAKLLGLVGVKVELPNESKSNYATEGRKEIKEGEDLKTDKGGKGGTEKTEKEIQTELDKLLKSKLDTQNELNKAVQQGQEIGMSYYDSLIDKITEYDEKISNLSHQFKFNEINPEVVPEDYQRENVPQKYETGKKSAWEMTVEQSKKNESEKIKENLSIAADGISKTFSGLMSTLNLGQDTFLGKMQQGWNFILNVVSTIASVLQGGKAIVSVVTMLIPLLFAAEGTNYSPGGLTVVGERGIEMVNLPKGSQVYKNSDTMQMLNNMNQPANIEVHNHYHNLIDGMTFKVNTDIKYKAFQKASNY